MSDEIESGAGVEDALPGTDPAAMALGLGSASREKADAFLDRQSRLADLQAHHLNEQFKQLGPKLWEVRLGVLLRVATMVVGLAIAAGIAAMVWNASHSNDVIVDSFSVPPDLAQSGMRGDVLAGQLVDHLLAMQNKTSTYRAPQTFANSFGENIKLEIPETGVSLSELDQFLREKLGNSTHIGGALTRTASGLRLTVRAAGEWSESVDDSEKNLDALVQRVAEAIYNRTQPYRYATYLRQYDRSQEAISVYQGLIKSDSSSEQAWAYIAIGTLSPDPTGDVTTDDAFRVLLRNLDHATTLDPGNALAWYVLGWSTETLGRSEEALSAFRKALAAVASEDQGHIRADAVPVLTTEFQAQIDATLGAFDAAAREQDEFARSGRTGASSGNSFYAAMFQALAHETGAARATMADPVPDLPMLAATGARVGRQARILTALSEEDWTGVLRAATAADPHLSQAQFKNYSSEECDIALAEARLGQFSEAEKRVRHTLADNYRCLIARGQIAELQGQNARADWWFARAQSAGPSLPFADETWGRTLLARGDAANAITKFTLANQKGPHFADPLEGWGEALMAQNRSDLALAKFAEAEKYAPNWGRLHLKWGEALGYAGKKDEAQKQFALAAALDLAPPEKSELSRVEHG